MENFILIIVERKIYEKVNNVLKQNDIITCNECNKLVPVWKTRIYEGKTMYISCIHKMYNKKYI